MRMAIAVLQKAEHQESTAAALVRGLAAHGDEGVVFPVGTPLPHGPFDAVCAWGWRRASAYRAQGHDVLVMERAYVADRFLWVSLGWNGLNGRALWPKVNDSSRWEQHFAHLMHPWRELNSDSRGVALLMGQVPSDTACRAVNLPSWLNDMASELAGDGWEVRFRPHPQSPPFSVNAAQHLGTTLEWDLAHASVAVTYNSNSAVDAVLAGVPTAAYDEGSTAWDVTSRDASCFVTPDRARWAHGLAWRQWLPAEIADGSAWAKVREVLRG